MNNSLTEYCSIEQIKNHEPKEYDIYIGKEKIFRLDVAKNECKSVWELSEYDIISKTWIKSSHIISELDLKNYYSYAKFDINELVDEALSIINDDVSENAETPSNVDEKSLITKSSKSDIQNIIESTEILKYKAENVSRIVSVYINRQKEILRKYSEKANSIVSKLASKVNDLLRVISVIEIYTGTNLSVTQISNGDGAGFEEPLTIRQRILFMDEEVAAIMEDGKGLGHENKDVFYEWIKTPKNRDIILPETRCIVVMKPRRNPKLYSYDRRDNDIMNKWNYHSFLMIRNGDNVYAIESEELFFSKTAIPTKKDWENATKYGGLYEKEKLKDLKYGGLFYAYLIQGLIDNTNYFGEHAPINVIDSVNVNLIFDDESDSFLGTNIKPFKEFLKDKNKSLKRGSRILYYGDYNSGKFLRHYSSKYNEPDIPCHGLYNIDTFDGVFGFRYMPGTQVWDNSECTYRDRKKRETWIVYEDIINYDNISVEELESYIKDRTQRKYYEDIFPLLILMLKEKRKEKEEEQNFINLIKQELPYVDDLLITEAINWWKNKVIFIRSLKSDDEKSWRMIKSYLETHF